MLQVLGDRMFIEFKTKDNKIVLLNKAQIVSIESINEPVHGIQGGGGLKLRIFATEGKAFEIDTKMIKFEDLRKQIEPQELTDGKDKTSPIR
jgi:hypothetical protein